jgi:proton glutamate symport protein
MRRLSLTHWILIGTVVGVVLGYLDHSVWLTTDLGAVLQPVSQIFIRMIKSIVAPLIFASLVVGIAGHGDDLKQVGRLAFRSIVYFEIVTTIALVIGLAAAHLAKPGIGISLTAPAEAGAQLAGTKTTVAGILEHTVPASIVDAMAKNETLQIVFFSVLFAIALTQVKGRPKELMLGLAESLTEVMFKFTGLVIKFAPIGIAAALGVTIGRNGLGVILSLGKLVLTMYVALVVFVLVALVPVAMLARLNLRKFWKWAKEPWLIAFTTASSEASLPLSLENME